MKDIKSLLNIILLILIYLTGSGYIKAQSLQEFMDKYHPYHYTELVKLSKDQKWAVMNYQNSDSLNFNKLIRLTVSNNEQKRTSESGVIKDQVSPDSSINLGDAMGYYFVGHKYLAYHQKDLSLIIRDLIKGTEIKIPGIKRVLQFEKLDMLVLEELNKDVKIIDENGKVIKTINKIKSFDTDFNKYLIYYLTDTQWGVYNLKNKNQISAAFSHSLDWIKKTGGELLGFNFLENSVNFYRFDLSTKKIIKEEFSLPQGFKITDNPKSYLEVRDERYLFLPLVTDQYKTQEKAHIYYTNLDSRLNRPMIQLSIYDLKEKKWQWLPDRLKPYERQILVSDNGDFITYDQKSEKLDSLSISKVKLTLFKDYGREKYSLKNPYYNNQNFYYDNITNQVLYYENGLWNKENLSTGGVSSVTLSKDKENPDYLLNDSPAGRIIPTNYKGKFIVEEEQDLYLWDIVNNTFSALTNGKKSSLSYEMLPQPLWELGYSNWTMFKSRIVNIDWPIVIKVFNTYTLESGIARIDIPKGNFKNLPEVKVLTYGKESIHQIIPLKTDERRNEKSPEKKQLIYTTYSYNEPLKLYQVSIKGKSNQADKKLLYASKGIFIGERPKIKKELLHYKANGKTLNAYLLYPTNYDSQKRYPLIVKVYEKMTKEVNKIDLIPNLNDPDGTNLMHYLHNGYFVLLPDLDYGINDGQKKLLSSIHAVMEETLKNPMLDAKRIAVVGSSFGGYEASFFMGRTSLFSTAVIGVPVVDLVHKSFSVYGMMDGINPDLRPQFGQGRMLTDIYKNWKGYLETSPIYYVPQVSRPVLLWGGSEDTNVNPDQVRSYFLGLKRMRKKAIYLDFQGEGHAIMNRKNQLDFNYKVWQWLEYFLKDKPAPEWMKPMLE
ncbi:alpha/beta hydrolase family protein [Elizabethkingia anophelis]|uniref:alpha/beta hydrolase family protein n=1 Tax=Elizabethkingia anophelis TaxID=1117645 RepID=UPI00389141B5